MEKISTSVIRQNIKRLLWVNLVNSIFFTIIIANIVTLALGKGSLYVIFSLTSLIFISLILLVFEVVTGLTLKRAQIGDEAIDKIALYSMCSIPFVPFIMSSIWISKNKAAIEVRESVEKKTEDTDNKKDSADKPENV